jgi:hypothetical protein
MHRVELLGLTLGKVHHSRGANLKAGSFEMGNNLPCFATRECVWLDNGQRLS